MDETGKAFVAKAPPKSETPVTLKDTTFSGEERAFVASANSFVKMVMDETASGVPTYEPPEGVTEIIDKSAPAEIANIAEQQMGNGGDKYASTRIANIAEEHMGKGLDAAIRAGAAQVYESYPEELKSESGVEGMLGFYGNDAVKLVQKEAQEQANAALKTQRLSADEILQSSLKEQYQLNKLAEGSGIEIMSDVSDWRATQGKKTTDIPEEIVNQFVRDEAMMRVTQVLTNADQKVSPSKEVMDKAIADAMLFIRADYDGIVEEEKENAREDVLRQEERVVLQAENPHLSFRWPIGADDAKPLTFAKNDPRAMEYMKRWDEAGSAVGQKDIEASYASYRVDLSKAASEAEQAATQLSAGNLLTFRSYQTKGGKREWVTDSDWRPAETEEDWDYYQSQIESNYRRFPTVYPKLMGAFYDSKKEWNLKVAHEYKDKYGVPIEKAVEIVDQMNNASAKWQKVPFGKWEDELEDLQKIGRFATPESMETGLQGVTKHPTPNAIPEERQFNTVDEANRANLPAGVYVLIDDKLALSE